MQITQLTYNIHSLISAPKIHTNLLWDLTFLFVSLAAVYFMGIFFFRNKISANAKKVLKRKNELSPMISEFLFYEEDATKNEKTNYVNLKIEIRQLLKDDFNRKVLSDILLDLRKDVSGDTLKQVLRLYKELDLHKDAYKKMKSWRWHVVSKAILELTLMQVSDAYDMITEFINDRRGAIRKQAEIATVSLRHEGISYFMDTNRSKISEWQQLKLLEVIRSLEGFEPPRFKAWLTSSNKYTVLFALRLIKYYNQNDINASLIELVKHKNGQIKNEAIKCIKEFHIVEALDTLKIIFWKSTADLKISILDTIAALGDENNIDFLESIDKKEANFYVKSKALSVINAIIPESILPTHGIEDISKYQSPDDIKKVTKVIESIDSSDDLNEEHKIIEVEKKDEILSTEVNDITIEDEQVSDSTPSIVIKNEEIEIDYPKEVIEALTTVESQSNELLDDLNEEIDTLEIKEENETTSDDINNITVDYECVLAETFPNTIENERIIATYSKDMKTDEDLEDINLDFLPIISIEDEEIDITCSIETETPDTITNIFEIEVGFDEVEPNVIDESKIEDLGSPAVVKDINMSELYFLPIVVDTVEPDEILTENTKYCYDLDALGTTKQEINISDIHIKFEEVIVSSSDASEQKVESIKVIQVEENTSRSYLDNDADTPKVNDIEVIFEEILLKIPTHAVETPVEDSIDTSKEDSFVEDNTSKDSIESSLDDETIEQKKSGNKDFKHGIINFPKIELYDEYTISKMRLLNDIEELGDEREIPLLNEYLKEEGREELKIRISEVINRFSNIEFKSKSEIKDSNKNIDDKYNVVKELFEQCDLESKVILLDSIIGIMDEDEIEFLEDLKNHEEAVIREKATIALKNLKKRLFDQEQSKKEDTVPSYDLTTWGIDFKQNAEIKYNSFLEKMEIDSSNSKIDILDVAFQLSYENAISVDSVTEKELEMDTIENTRSFMDYLRELQSKLFNG